MYGSSCEVDYLLYLYILKPVLTFQANAGLVSSIFLLLVCVC